MAEQSVDAGSLQAAFRSDLTHYPPPASPTHSTSAPAGGQAPGGQAAGGHAAGGHAAGGHAAGGHAAGEHGAAGRPAAAVSTAAPGASSTATPVGQPAAAEVQAAVARANANLAASNRVLDYRVDAATGLTIAIVRNAQTGALVQQIPGADIIALAQMLAAWSPGKHLLLDLIA